MQNQRTVRTGVMIACVLALAFVMAITGWELLKGPTQAAAEASNLAPETNIVETTQQEVKPSPVLPSSSDSNGYAEVSFKPTFSFGKNVVTSNQTQKSER